MHPAPIVHQWPLRYGDRLARRSAAAIDLVVVHCTELPDLAMARSYGERVLYPDTATGASGHYYIDRDGSTHCFVEPLRIAHHTRGYNERSIGIELINLGRYPDWCHSAHQRMSEPYPAAQISALLALIERLRAELPALDRIAGHDDLDRAELPASDDPAVQVRRKLDPGPMFP